MSEGEGTGDGASDGTSDGHSAWVTTSCSFAVLLAVALSYKHLDSNGGTDRKIHAAYCAATLFAAAIVPETLSSYFFTQLTVTLVGAVYPIYRSTKAVCTPDEDDDKEWLQYWIVGGVLFMFTGWVHDADTSGVGWLGLLTLAFLWLYFPLTCGSLLMYEHVTKPYLEPRLKPMQRKMNNFVLYIYQSLANAIHLYLVWIIFMFLPVGLKRIVAIAVGTVFPFVSSVTAASTDEIEDDTYWLTYWSVYGCLFVLMNMLEHWLGRIPGFYTLVIFITVYLMLPMFRGADKVFRKVLVPLAGLQELLILRDSIQIKKQLLKDLDAERATVMRKSIAGFFNGDDSDADPGALKGEYMQSWSALNTLKDKASKAKEELKKNLPFGTASKAKDEKAPSETTNLV